MKTWRILNFRSTLVVAGLITTGILVACYGDNVGSIHFYGAGFGDKQKYDFGRVPQEVMIPGWNNEPKRGGTSNDSGIPSFENFDGEPLTDTIPPEKRDWYGNDNRNDVYGEMQDAVHKARNFEIRHEYGRAARAFRSLSPAKRIQSFAKDREELIELGMTAKTKGYAEYLRYRYLLEFGYEKEIAEARERFKSLDHDPKLEPHIQYALASFNPDQKLRQPTIDAFLAVAEKYPSSKRAEPSLVMAGRAYLETTTWERASSNDWQAGIDIFKRVLANYPKTRFRDNIEGWLGADEIRRNNQIGALIHYIKQSKSPDAREAWKGHQALAEIARSEGRIVDATVHWLSQRDLQTSTHFRVTSSSQIRNAFQGFSQKDAQKIQAKIKNSPRLLSAYLDFRMEDTRLNIAQERQLLKYVTDNIGRAGKVEPNVYGRLGQLQYSSGNYRESLRFARLAKFAHGEVGDRARFVEASSLDRMGRHQEAIQRYEALLRRKPKNYLLHGCSEQLALLQEKHGNPIRAYGLYKAIGYREDVAFLVDSELSPRQISQLIRMSPSHEERSVLKYSLGMRLFRLGDYDQARHVLERIPKEVRMQYASHIAELMSRYGEEKPPPAIDALEDVKVMLALRHQAERARSQESRGIAIYALAQYTHKRRNLMFYSVPLWDGGRSVSYCIYWNDEINRGEFNKIAHDSAYEHECDAQTLKFCQEVIRRCPQSSVMPKALYSAGVAAESLTRFNQYWSGFNDHLLTKASRYMKRVAREYPHDSLAKSAKKYGNEFAEDRKPEY